MADIRKVHRDKRMPTFLVELWNEDNYDEHDLPKHIKKRMWAGRVECIQTKESIMFRQVSELLGFMEDRRV